MHAKRSIRFLVSLALALAAAGPRAAVAEDAVPEAQACSMRSLVAQARAGIHQGSPAYRKYLRALLKESALQMSADALTEAFNDERDPDMVELLGGALATKASFSESPALVQPVLARAASDGDPAARAAAVRALRATGSVEVMASNGNAVTYEQLVRDAAPEVRQAVADNLAAESAEVYSGHDRGLSEAAVRAAAASTDPQVTASILSRVSMERVGPDAVGQLERLLNTDDPRVRAAAAQALGEAPASQSASITGDLLARYRNDPDPAVRRAILEAIARRGQAGALRTLADLRGIAPALDPEIDAWRSALALGLQDWTLILREKERITRSQQGRNP